MTGREKLQYEFEAGFTNQYLDSMISNRVASGAFTAGSNLFNLSEQNRTGLWDLLENRSVGDWSQYLLQKMPMCKRMKLPYLAHPINSGTIFH